MRVIQFPGGPAAPAELTPRQRRALIEEAKGEARLHHAKYRAALKRMEELGAEPRDYVLVNPSQAA